MWNYILKMRVFLFGESHIEKKKHLIEIKSHNPYIYIPVPISIYQSVPKKHKMRDFMQPMRVYTVQ